MPHDRRFRTRLALPILAVALMASGCNSGIGTEVSRAAARSVVDQVVAQRFPGVPLKPTTDCIIDNATGNEIVALATSAAAQDQEAAARTVLEIAQRPATVRCIASQDLPAILNTL